MRKELDKNKLSWQLEPSNSIPPEVSLPYKFLPHYKYQDYTLDGKTDICEFFKQFEKAKQEEEDRPPKEEPRLVTQLLKDKEEEFKNVSKYK